MSWAWVFAGVMLVFAVAAFVWNVRESRRLEAALRSCTDAQLNRLARVHLDGRQSRWINDERRRRGIA